MSQRVTVSTTASTISSSTTARCRDLKDCSWHDAKTKLRTAGLRLTSARVALGQILFAQGDRHVTAKMLYEEAHRAKVPLALASVYNTLNSFTEVGLLRHVTVGSKLYFDTNNSEHDHFYIEDQHELVDVPTSDVVLRKAPVPPEGYEIVRVDVVIRLRRKAGITRKSSPAA
jgi:Fur family transcriptional regulator, iron response regulator